METIQPFEALQFRDLRTTVDDHMAVEMTAGDAMLLIWARFPSAAKWKIISTGRKGSALPKPLWIQGASTHGSPQKKLEQIGVNREKKDLKFTMANGEIITRSVGFVILRVGHSFTIDEVVFAEPGDQILLGARTLEGLNLVVDSSRKKLVAAGPLPAA